MDYGNTEIGTAVDTFWLPGPLKISAVEQTRFLAKLAQDALPFPPKCSEKRPRNCLIRSRGKLETLCQNWLGKRPGPGVGWWVGWVQKEGRVYAFALNKDMSKASDASKRVELVKASLKVLRIL